MRQQHIARDVVHRLRLLIPMLPMLPVGGWQDQGAAQVDKAALQIGAIAFIHRFGSSLNGHVHFHVCAVDGVFEEPRPNPCHPNAHRRTACGRC